MHYNIVLYVTLLYCTHYIMIHLINFSFILLEYQCNWEIGPLGLEMAWATLFSSIVKAWKCSNCRMAQIVEWHERCRGNYYYRQLCKIYVGFDGRQVQVRDIIQIIQFLKTYFVLSSFFSVRQFEYNYMNLPCKAHPHPHGPITITSM